MALTRKLMTAGIAFVLLAGAGLLVARGIPPSGTNTSPVPPPGDRIAKLEERLARQEQRFARLEALLVGRRLTPEQQRNRMEERQRRMDLLSDPVHVAQEQKKTLETYARNFTSEHVDRAWAGRTEVFVRDVIDASVAESGIAAIDRQIECRSTQCRIDLDLGTGVTADELLQPMLTNLAEALPNARIVLVPSADGTGTRMHVFAGKRPLPLHSSNLNG